MAEIVSDAETSDESLQQELIALRQRVAQLEQQLAAGAAKDRSSPSAIPACPDPALIGELAPSQPDTPQFWGKNLQQLNQQLEQRTIELRQNEARLHTIAASIPGAIFQFSTAGKVWRMDYISDRVADLTGIPASEILQDMGVLNQCAHPDDRHRYFHSLLKAVSTGTPWRYEGRIVKPDGGIVWFQGEAVPAAHDRTVFYGVILDITDRKIAELALQESQQFIHSIAENSPSLLHLYDLTTQTSLYINRGVTEYLGYSAAEVQEFGSTLLDTIIHPDDRHRVTQYHNQIRALADGEAAELEYRLRHRNGEWRWFASRKTVFKRDATGAVLQYLGAAQDVTDRKQAETALEESRRFLRRVLDTLPNQHIFWKDQNSVFLGCNRLAAKAVGLKSPREIIGKTDYDLSSTTEEAASFRDADRRVMASNCPELGIIESHRKPTGEQSWLETNKIPLHDAAGNVTGILVAFQDITERQEALQERKRASAQLQEQEQFLRSIYDGVDYSIFALEVAEDQEFRYLGMNAVAERAIGITQADYLGKTPAQVLTPEIAALSYERFNACVQAGVSCTWEDYLPFQGEAWWMTTITPLKDETGRVHRLVGTSINTTDRKRAEAQLLEQEQFLRSIYDGVACSIFVVDVREDGEFIYNGLNKAAEEFTGHKSAEVSGKTLEERFGPDESKLIRRGFERCVQSGTPVIEEEQFTVNGQEAWFLTTLNPIRNREGRIFRIVGTAFNVLSLKQAQAQLQQQATDLEATLQELQRTQSRMVQAEKMSSLGQLVAGVAHEINNPVNFIFGNLNHANDYIRDLLKLVQLYQKHYPDPVDAVAEEIAAIDLEFLAADLPKLLNSMKVGADRIQSIVASLRNFSRMDESEKKAVNIHEGIDSTLMILQSRIKAKADRPEISVIKHYGDLPLVECYAGQLNQVFMNLLSNAIDALEEARPTIPTLTIQTSLTRSNQLQVSITDNGGGVPDACRSRLFDPFFTTKPVGKGTGMGLSISYQIVTEKHNGTLECLSQPEGGATFVMTIPLKLAARPRP